MAPKPCLRRTFVSLPTAFLDNFTELKYQKVKNTIGEKSISAIFWGGGGSVLRILLQFGAQITLARLLGPEQYGLFAIGAIVLSFSNFFSDIGLAYGLIQKAQVTNDDIRFTFTWQVLLGTGVTIAVAMSANSIALFFGDERSAEIIRYLSVICLLNALAAPSLNLLKRNLDFRRIQIAQISSYIVGYVLVGIPLAMSGAQVWALVAAWLIQVGLMTTLLYVATRHSVRPLVWCEGARSQLAYGGTVLATNMTNWMINNIDRVVVGRVFSSREMGLYATPYNLLYNPTTSLLGVIQPVFFSSSARIADQPGKIAAAYRSLIGAVCMFILPIFAGAAAVAETFVLALYGTAWQQSAEVFRPLALVMPLFLIWGLSTPMLWTAGHVSREFRSQLPLALAWIAVSWGAAQISLAAVGWATLVLFALRCAVILGSVIRLLALSLGAIWKAAQGGIAISAIIAFGLYFLDIVFRSLSPLPAIWLLGDILSALLIAVCTLAVAPTLCAPDLAALLLRLTQRMPESVGRHVRRYLANTRVTKCA